jgi:hypothetical protein
VRFGSLNFRASFILCILETTQSIPPHRRTVEIIRMIGNKEKRSEISLLSTGCHKSRPERAPDTVLLMTSVCSKELLSMTLFLTAGFILKFTCFADQFLFASAYSKV